MRSYLSVNVGVFALFHLASLAVFFLPFKWEYLWLAILTYYIRMFFITAAYHRYFAHRAFKTNRFFQFLLAFFAMTSSQKGVLWWASHHRDHHRHSDRAGDVHSPQQGWLWSHMGWFLSNRHTETDFSRIQDFAKFPELRWLDRHWTLPVWFYALVLYLWGGWMFILWGFFVSTVLLWHGTFTINSLAHLWGSQKYETSDNSRNNLVLALLTLGEGWHNNHHRYPSAVRNGFKWWEVDITFYILKIFSWLKLIEIIPRQVKLQ